MRCGTRRTSRTRRARLAAGVVAVALLPVACGDDPPSAGAAHVESKVAHARATPDEAQAGSSIVRTVGAKLYAPLAADAGDGNVAFSPLSITTALGMTRAGAEGTSADQLDAFLDADGSTDLHRAINGADETLRSLAGPVQLLDGETMDEITVDTANSLWGQSGVTFEAPFLDELRSSYDASMWTADFINDSERARREINDWVAGHTGEKITDLLPEDSIGTVTRLVLVNAMHFAARWPEKLETYPDATFTTAAGDDVTVPMLGIDATLARSTGEGWQSITLPYAGSTLGLTLLIPDRGKLAEVEAALDEDLLLAATTGKPTQLMVRFPCWDLDSSTPLSDALKGLGVTEPFATDDDFLPMTTDPQAQPLHLDAIYHQATVTVDEFGTEAAAATAAVFNTVGAAINDVPPIVVDRPFLFVIHDLATATPMFVGRVADPTAS